jgi:hypothetical protein
MQQACKRNSGETRRGGVKPRGRNETPSVAARGRRGGAQARLREWTRCVTARAAPARAVDGGASGGAARVTGLALPTPREEDRETGRGSRVELRRGAKRGPTNRLPRGSRIGDSERKTSKVRAVRETETSVRPGRERGRPNDPLRWLPSGEHPWSTWAASADPNRVNPKEVALATARSAVLKTLKGTIGAPEISR